MEVPELSTRLPIGGKLERKKISFRSPENNIMRD